VIAELEGPAWAILGGERVALNFVMRMSGIATLTRRYVDAIEGTAARVVDTRKTTPGLRLLEKAAVGHGGGYNHRFGLDDGILIKDNHLHAAGVSLGEVVERARRHRGHLLRIEVEVGNLEETAAALEARADVILLDNMSVADMAEAVRRVAGRAVLEASGNITLERVREVAETGVDLISVGALTHSAPAADIALDFVA
jgi:nicotinate-nucleotide pyrophosphorylase (carboxylating)